MVASRVTTKMAPRRRRPMRRQLPTNVQLVPLAEFLAPPEATYHDGLQLGAEWARDAYFAQLDDLLARESEYRRRAKTRYKIGLLDGALAVARAAQSVPWTLMAQ